MQIASHHFSDGMPLECIFFLILGPHTQERLDALGLERQREFDRAGAAEVARAALEVQLAGEQQRVVNLGAQVQKAAAETQVTAGS